PVDGAGLRPERVPAEGRAPGGLLGRRHRPAAAGPPGDPRRDRGRPVVVPGGPRLRRPGAGTAGPRRHGARPRRRQARRPRPAPARLRVRTPQTTNVAVPMPGRGQGIAALAAPPCSLRLRRLPPLHRPGLDRSPMWPPDHTVGEAMASTQGAHLSALFPGPGSPRSDLARFPRPGGPAYPPIGLTQSEATVPASRTLGVVASARRRAGAVIDIPIRNPG